MIGASAKRRSRSLVTAALLFGLLASAANGGCDCQGGPVHTVAPQIVVTPKAITFPATAVNAEADQVVTIRNNGSENLKITSSPKLVEGTQDKLAELALRQVLDAVDCATGASRNAKDPTVLLPGDCDTVTVVYRPLNVGKDTGKLIIKSDDPKRPEVDVPIDATGAAPKIEVCLLAGDCVTKKICNQPGQQLTLPFPLTAINATTTCNLSISNQGQLPLRQLQWMFKSGNRYKDYTLDPTDLGKLGDLPAGQGIQTKIHFGPKAGGAHDAIVEITSSDPNQGVVVVNLTGKGDGPKLCPDPMPTVDYGTVTVNTTKTKQVKLTDCGTKDLSITKLQVQDATGTGASAEFKLGSAAPPVPIALTPGQSTQVPVDFTPDSASTFNGRLYLESTDPVVPSGWLNLTGQGETPPSCELQVATTNLDFGTTAPGYPVKKTLAVSNPGQLDCTGVTATLTAGANVKFSITGTPAGSSPWTLHPGDIVTFEITYAPADATGPDTGTLEIGANELSTPLDVTLQGTPTATPECTLAVTPKAGTFNLTGCITLTGTSPRFAAYGSMRVGTTKVLPLTLQNTSAVPCTVNWVKMYSPYPLSPLDPAFTLKTPAAQVLVGGKATSTIPPGQTGEALVAYTPAKQQLDCGLAMVQTTATNLDSSGCGGLNNPNPNAGCFQVFLQGTGVQSDIEIIPSSVDFGVITLGCASLERTVTIYNTGQASLNLTSIYLSPPGKGKPASGPFTLTSVPPLPFALAGGSSVQIKVKFRPPDTATHNAVLAIESDAQNASIMTVPLTGQGTSDSHQTDTFTQLTQPEVDVLWMIDDSCSMTDKQKNLANNAQTFFQRAIQLNTNYHMAIVTTDMDNPAESGNFQSRNGAPKLITPALANPVQDFIDDCQLGTMGSGHEQGLAAVHAALTPPLVNDPAKNGGFLRDQAKLVIIAVSDEDDQSSGTVDFYVDFLKNIKGFHNADMMTFSSVVGYDETTKKPASCATGKGGVAVPGPRYIAVTQRTNGIAKSICSTDWGQIANDLGLNAFGLQSQFFLTREPVASSIVVKVNGTQVSQPSWSYDGPSNSVIFTSTAVPPKGATITIDYDTVCH